jgi:hypothetical protein
VVREAERRINELASHPLRTRSRLSWDTPPTVDRPRPV